MLGRLRQFGLAQPTRLWQTTDAVLLCALQWQPTALARPARPTWPAVHVPVAPAPLARPSPWP